MRLEKRKILMTFWNVLRVETEINKTKSRFEVTTVLNGGNYSIVILILKKITKLC